MSRTKTLLRSLLAIGACGAVAAFGTFSAFSSTTSNPGNKIAAGTVALGDNDAEQVMYDVSNAKALQQVERCIKVSYTGSLDADVKLYLGGDAGALGQYLDLKVEAGTQASSVFPTCTDFQPETGAALYEGTLSAFAAAHTGWADGLAHSPGGAGKWAQGDARVYRVTLTVKDTNAARNLATGAHGFTWEARNQ